MQSEALDEFSRYQENKPYASHAWEHIRAKKGDALGGYQCDSL